MGTKMDPGKFDCYTRLEPDEPYFLLRAKDPAAPYLVMMWEASRRGAWSDLLEMAMAMTRNEDVQFRVSSDSYPKLMEARACAEQMNAWRVNKYPEQVSTGGTVMRGSLTVTPSTRTVTPSTGGEVIEEEHIP